MSALAEQRIQVTDVGIREAVRAQSPAQGRRPTPAAKKMQGLARRHGNRSWHGIGFVSRRVIDLRMEQARTGSDNNKT